jgi:hypothetical protein
VVGEGGRKGVMVCMGVKGRHKHANAEDWSESVEFSRILHDKPKCSIHFLRNNAPNTHTIPKYATPVPQVYRLI